MQHYSIKKHFSSKSLQEEIWALFCLDSIRQLFYQIVEDGMSAGFKLPNKQKLFLHFFSLFSFFFSCFHHSHECKRIKYLFDISSAHKKYFFVLFCELTTFCACVSWGAGFEMFIENLGQRICFELKFWFSFKKFIKNHMKLAVLTSIQKKHSKSLHNNEKITTVKFFSSDCSTFFIRLTFLCSIKFISSKNLDFL